VVWTFCQDHCGLNFWLWFEPVQTTIQTTVQTTSVAHAGYLSVLINHCVMIYCKCMLLQQPSYQLNQNNVRFWQSCCHMTLSININHSMSLYMLAKFHMKMQCRYMCFFASINNKFKLSAIAFKKKKIWGKLRVLACVKFVIFIISFRFRQETSIPGARFTSLINRKIEPILLKITKFAQ